MDLKHVFLRPAALILAAAIPFAQLPVNAMSASSASALTAAASESTSVSEADSASYSDSTLGSEDDTALYSDFTSESEHDTVLSSDFLPESEADTILSSDFTSKSESDTALNSDSLSESSNDAALYSDSIPASEANTALYSDSIPASEANTALPSDTTPESESAMTSISESAPTARATTESHIITGFGKAASCLNKLYFSINQKPSLSSLLDRLPDTLDVYLDGSDTMISIPVTWFCVGEDYEESDGYYFQFSPQWDESTYILSDQLNLLADAPYIGVFFTSVNESDSNDNNSLSGDGITAAAVTSSSYEEEIFRFLVNEIGFNSAGACGVMANLYYESSFNPNANGDGGTSYGICQWHNDRYDSLKSWCKKNGYDYTTLNGQLNYLKFELSQNNSSYLWNGKTIYNNISAVDDRADGSYDSGYYWCVNYEVPANKETVGVTRGNLAKNTYWPEYNTNIASCTATLSSTVCAYTGKERNPSVTVKNGDTTLKKGTYYTVTYKNNIEIGTGSAIIKGKGNYSGTVTLKYTIRLRTPALSKVSNTASGIKVTWDAAAVTGATGYYVYHKNPGGKWTRIANIKSGTTGSYVDTEVTTGETYIYTVKAYDGNKNTSKYEKGLTIYRLPRPSISNLSNPSSKKLKVEWKKNTKAKGYQINYSTESDFSSKTSKTIKENTTTSHTFTDLKKNEKYYVRIRTYKRVDGIVYYSAWSKVQNIKLSK